MHERHWVDDDDEQRGIQNGGRFHHVNQWCVLYGENIQDGICGFGNTPLDAIRAFNMDWGKGELK